MRASNDLEVQYRNQVVERLKTLHDRLDDYEEQKNQAKEECKNLGREIAQCEREISKLQANGSLKDRWNYHQEHGSMNGYQPILIGKDVDVIVYNQNLITAHKEQVDVFATVIRNSEKLMLELKEDAMFAHVIVNNITCTSTILDVKEEQWFGEPVEMFSFMLILVETDITMKDVTIYRKTYIDKDGKMQMHHRFFEGSYEPSKPLTSNNKLMWYIIDKYLNEHSSFSRGNEPLDSTGGS